MMGVAGRVQEVGFGGVAFTRDSRGDFLKGTHPVELQLPRLPLWSCFSGRRDL